MQESTTYQAILREGRNKGLEEGGEQGRIRQAQHFLVRVGTKRFGKPDKAILAAIEAIRDVERLESLGDRIIDATVRDWESLLGAADAI